MQEMIAELHAAQFAEDDVDSISNPTKENTGAQLHAPDEGNDDGRFGEGTGSGKEGGAESKFSDSEDEGNEEIHCNVRRRGGGTSNYFGEKKFRGGGL